MKLNLKPGRYFAGVSIPFFIPNSAVVNGVEELGGRNVTITSRGNVNPLPVNPRIDPQYDDDWDELVVADYHGEPKTIETPKRWKWLILRARPKNAMPVADFEINILDPEKPVVPKRGGALIVLGASLLGGVAALWALARRRRKP